MKKFIVIMLAVLMVFALVACKGDVPDEGEQDTQVSKSQGKDNLIAQGSAAGSKAIDHKGFRVVCNFTVSGEKTTIELGGKDSLFWLGTSEGGAAITADAMSFWYEKKESNDTYTIKIFDDSENQWTALEGLNFSIKTLVFDALVDNILYIWDSMTTYFAGATPVKAAVETYGGRTCTKYTAQWTLASQKLADITLWVDNEFGVTMGMTFAPTAALQAMAAAAGDEMVDFINYTATLDLDLSAADLAAVPGYAAAAAAQH